MSNTNTCYLCMFSPKQVLRVDLTTPILEEEVITSVCVKTLYSERTEQGGLHVLVCLVQNIRILLLVE